MLDRIVDYLVYNLLPLNPETRLGESVNYFLYDVLKILLLILLVVFVVSFLRTYLPPEKINRIYAKQRFGLGNLMASIFGAVTPFCSCSSIPIFIGFLQARVPVGVAFSFIITSPLVNEVMLIMMGGLFGWRVAVIYALAGILIGTLAGIIIDKLGLGKGIILKVKEQESKLLDLSYMPRGLKGKGEYAWAQTKSIFKKLWWIILIGVGIGAIIHGYIPAEVFTDYLHINSILAVPIAVLVGIPLYAGCSTMVPVVFAITAKGIPLGTALAFLMSVAGLSAPEAVMLKRVLSWKLLSLFYLIVAIGIIIVGYVFNLFGL
ncbi:permease [Patescibacteria group bacterium]|nr:permease [Patescibacteria group bacterium]